MWVVWKWGRDVAASVQMMIYLVGSAEYWFRESPTPTLVACEDSARSMGSTWMKIEILIDLICQARNISAGGELVFF